MINEFKEFYDCIPNIYDSTKTHEIMFDKELLQWKGREYKSEQDWTIIQTANEVVDYLKTNQLDLDFFKASMRNKLLTKAVYYDMKIKRYGEQLVKLRKTLSDETVDEAIVAYQRFGEELKETIKTVLEKPKLTILN